MRGRPPDNPAGLLQKDSGYFADHQAALDGIWSEFNAGLASALKATIVPTAEIVSNPGYNELATPEVVKVLGMDATPAKSYLEPHGGLRYVVHSTAHRGSLPGRIRVEAGLERLRGS